MRSTKSAVPTARWHTSNHATIWRWRSAYQNDFAARMDWTIKPYAEANHPPLPKLAHAHELSARPGERVNLSAEGSSDPDGDALSYEWFYYGEAGTFTTSSGRSGQPVDDSELRSAEGLVHGPHGTRHAARHRDDARHSCA